MSRNIPRVRTWLVRYWDGKTVVRQCFVETINKRFARMMAREKIGWASVAYTRVTVSLVRN